MVIEDRSEVEETSERTTEEKKREGEFTSFQDYDSTTERGMKILRRTGLD